MTFATVTPVDPERIAASATAVRHGVARLSRRLRADRPPEGIGLTALSVLSRLYRSGTHTASELAAAEGLQPQSLTRALAELTDRQLVSRRADPADGRQSLIDLTQLGIEVLTSEARARDGWLAEAMASLTATEVEVLRLAGQLMDRLSDA